MAFESRRPRRIAVLRVLVALAAAAFALAVRPEIGRVAVLVLLSVSWVALIIFIRIEERGGRSLGMWTYVWLYGVALTGLFLWLLFGS